MALTTTTNSPTFLRLVQCLESVLPGDAQKIAHPLSLGIMEELLQHAHHTGNPIYPSDDVEVICRWPFEGGALVAALLKARFLEEVGSGRVAIVDYWLTAPEYVRDRQRMRETRAAKKAQKGQDTKSHIVTPPRADNMSPIVSRVPNSSKQFRTVPVEGEGEGEGEGEKEVDPSAEPSRTENSGHCARATSPESASVRRACAQGPEGTATSTGQMLARMAIPGLCVPGGAAPGGRRAADPPKARQGGSPSAKAADPHPPTEADRGPQGPPTRESREGSETRAAAAHEPPRMSSTPEQNQRIQRLAKEAHEASGDPPHYATWWMETCRRAVVNGVDGDLSEAIQYAGDCAAPVTRKLKDLGELQRPGAFIAKRVQASLLQHGVNLPAKPKVSGPPAHTLN